MLDDEYTFRIDAFTPETLPMARMAEYMAALAELIGFRDSNHFVRIEPGSARLVSRIDHQDAPKVRERLNVAGSPAAPKDLARAFKALDEMLADDNAIGDIAGAGGAIIIEFPGRTRPTALAFPAFWQDGSIDGQIVSIGGRDKTAHLILQNGLLTYSNIDLPRAAARDLAAHLYGPKIRVFGRGKWERHPDGAWKLLSFIVDRHELLDDVALPEVLAEIRAMPGNGLMADSDIYNELMSLRGGEDELH